MTQRTVTQRPWNERPEQSDQTANVLMALGFEPDTGFMSKSEYDGRGTLVKESFVKRTGPTGNGTTEFVVFDYTWVRTYKCACCDHVCLAADKYTHEARMREISRYGYENY